MNLIGVAEETRSQFKSAQLRNLYRRDFQAWKADVLGLRTYGKMQEIMDTALFGDKNRTAIKSANGTSKDLDVDTPILTTDGWKTMGTVEVGDFVYSETGEPIEVVWKSDVYNKPSYKVSFDDGSFLVGSDSHEWNTITLLTRLNNPAWGWDDTETVTTGHIAKTLGERHLIPNAFDHEQRGRTIVAVEEVPSRPTQCIQVDSPRHLYLAGKGLIPTHNSFEVSAAISWVGSVHEPGETLSIITAPSLDQVSRVIFGYMRSFRTMAARRGFELPGWLNEREEWKFAGPSGNLNLAFGKKPAAGQEVSVFQGTRSEFGRTYVWIEEAGGVSKGLYTAAEAVLTGKHARGIYIGNPDNAESEFRGLFEDRKFDDEVNRFTISAYDLPTLTGEIVYPDDPDMQQRMMDSLTQPGWVEHKKRIWGENDARYLSKVLGEFPPDSGFGFFSTEDINTAMDTEIPDDGAIPCIFGVDIARFGTDECVIYVNRGGRVRLLDSWGKTDLYESAQRIYEHAQRLQPTEIRVDATGMGAGVKDFLFKDPQFAGEWDVIAIDGADSAPDKKKFHNMRAYIHDSAKTQMQEGLIDLDLIDDEDLKEQLTLITYKFNSRGAVQISLKSDMQTEMGGSPDRADAFIYSVCDMTPWTGNPLNQFTPGERLVKEAQEIIKAEPPIQWYGRPGDAF